MGVEYYYTNDGREVGPVSGQQLKLAAAAGELKPTDRVREGSSDRWVTASQVKGLFPDFHDKVREKAAAVGKTAKAVKKAAEAVEEAVGKTVKTVKKVAKHVGESADAVEEAAEKVRKATTAVAGIAAGGSTLAGSVGDFLRPLGPVNAVVLAAAILSGVVLFALARRKTEAQVTGRLKLGAVASLCVALVFGLWTGLDAATGKGDKGALASNLPAVERVQESVLPARAPMPVETPAPNPLPPTSSPIQPTTPPAPAEESE